MSMVDRCNVGRRRLLALLGSGAAATIGGAVSIQADAGASGDPMSVSGDVAAHDPLSTRLTRDTACAFRSSAREWGSCLYPPLVTAVSNAGGIGVLGNAHRASAEHTTADTNDRGRRPEDSSASISFTTPRHSDLRPPTNTSTSASPSACRSWSSTSTCRRSIGSIVCMPAAVASGCRPRPWSKLWTRLTPASMPSLRRGRKPAVTTRASSERCRCCVRSSAR